MSDYGPNMAKLILMFASRVAIPNGGGLADGIKFFTDQDHRKRVLARAEQDTLVAIQAIKSAPDNTYGDDDEAIAGVLLDKIKERLDAQRKRGE